MINLLNTKEQKGTKATTHEVKLNAKKIFISNTVAGPLLFCGYSLRKRPSLSSKCPALSCWA